MNSGGVLFKKGVLPIHVLAPAGVRILGTLDAVGRSLGFWFEVTCADGEHGPNDPHTLGSAYDISVLDWPADRVAGVHESLALSLGSNFTVLYETPVKPGTPMLADIAFVNPNATAPHIHIQLKRMTVYAAVDLKA